MPTPLTALKTVAALDAKLFGLKAQRSNVPRQIEEKSRSLQALKAELAEKQAELKDLQAKTALKENELKAAEQAVIKFREQIGRARSNKEFQALQHEILSKEADNTRLEDAVLLQMQKMDKKKEERDAVAAQLKEAEARVAEQCSDLESGLSRIESTIEELTAERTAATKDVPADILARYERLIERRGQTAMVAATNGTCQGCFMKLRAETMAQLRKGTDLVFCHSCARILYLPEDEAD